MWKKILKRTLLVLLVIFVAIQFIRPAKNRSDNNTSTNHISKLYAVPHEVDTILKTSCNDCHSNNTAYPWYAQVQPVAWWLDNHIRDGKKDLNFDEFATYPVRKQYKRMEDIGELVEKDEMPLKSYLWIHKYAKLNEQQKLTIANWVVSVRDTIKAIYPPDSLIRRKK